MRVHDVWWLTPQRVAIHEPTRIAVLADLHLGYAQARRGAGDAIPDTDLDFLLEPLADACREWECSAFVVAGDLFERSCTEELLTALENWQRRNALELLALVPGNHDRGLAPFADRLPLHPDGFALGDWLVVHGDRPIPKRPVVLGHWHPAVPSRGGKRPCFLAGPSSLILPAFSLDAAGVNLRRDPRFAGCRCFPIAGGEVQDAGKLPPVPSAPESLRPKENSRPWRGRLRPG